MSSDKAAECYKIKVRTHDIYHHIEQSVNFTPGFTVTIRDVATRLTQTHPPPPQATKEK
jgi:hypothetical protein